MACSIMKYPLWLFLLVAGFPCFFAGSFTCDLYRQPFVVLQKDAVDGELTVLYWLTTSSMALEELEMNLLNRKSRQLMKLNVDDLLHKYEEIKALVASKAFSQEGYLRWSEKAPDALNHEMHVTNSKSFARDLMGLEEDLNTLESILSKAKNDKTNNTQDLFLARECNCFEPYYPVTYCPLAAQKCFAPDSMSPHIEPFCEDKSFSNRFQKLLFYISWFWLAIVLGYILFTENLLFCLTIPANACGHVINKCICGNRWNEVWVDRMMRRNPELARDVVRAVLVRYQMRRAESRRISSNGETQKQPMSFVLKTTTYHCSWEDKTKDPSDDDVEEIEEVERTSAISEHDDSTKEEPICTICLGRLVEGDKIGSLDCEHLYHSDCLKSWLQRRNACPLCQVKIASPRFGSAPTKNPRHEEEASANLDGVVFEI